MQSQFVKKINATDEPPQLKIKSCRHNKRTEFTNDALLDKTCVQVSQITGAIPTKLRRKEFAWRKVEMKLMKDGCCSTFHVLLIIQTPETPSAAAKQQRQILHLSYPSIRFTNQICFFKYLYHFFSFVVSSIFMLSEVISSRITEQKLHYSV